MAQKTLILTAGKLDRLAGAAFEIVISVVHGLMPTKRMKEIASRYCAWAGLAEATMAGEHTWSTTHVLDILGRIEKERLRIDELVDRIRGIYDDNELPSDHPYGLLLRYQALIPHFMVLRGTEPLKSSESQDAKRPTGVDRKPKIEVKLPDVVQHSALNEKDVERPEVPPARIDRSVAVWLSSMKLNNSENVTDIRLYLSLLGARVLSDHEKARRDCVFSPNTVHQLAAKRALEEEDERKKQKALKTAKQRERAALKAKIKAEKKAKREAKKHATNPVNAGAGNTAADLSREGQQQ